MELIAPIALAAGRLEETVSIIESCPLSIPGGLYVYVIRGRPALAGSVIFPDALQGMLYGPERNNQIFLKYIVDLFQ